MGSSDERGDGRSAFSSWSRGGADAKARPAPSQDVKGLTKTYTGVVNITSMNINDEMSTRVPLMLYFTVTSSADCVEYTRRLCHQVDQTNRRLESERMGDIYHETGKDKHLAIKLGIVDCLKEPGLAQKYPIDPHAFPIILFIYRRSCCDRMIGTVTEAHIKNSVEAFIEFAKEQVEEATSGTGPAARLRRVDDDDENAMTLLKVAHGKLETKDMVKAKELYNKALEFSMSDVREVNQRHHVDAKKMTPQLWAQLKREPCYNTAPTALCGLAMCEMACKNRDAAVRYIDRLRADFPFAVHDLRDVAVAVGRIDMIALSDYDAENDSMLTLLRRESEGIDTVEFYKRRLKLISAHFFESSYKAAIEEGLRLVRAEPKILAELKDGHVIPRDLVLSPHALTPARKALQIIFRTLGPHDENVVLGRRMYQQYT